MRSFLFLLPLASAMGCAPKSSADVDALAAQVEALQSQVEALETFQKKVEMVVELPEDPEAEMAALGLAYEARDALGQDQTARAIAVLREIVEKYPGTQVAPAAIEMLRELEMIGSDAGELSVQSWLQGEHTVDPQALTILVFFEAWCPHCQREMPTLQATFEALDDKGLDVVGITNLSRGTTEADMAGFLDEAGVTFAVARDNGTLSSRFGAQGVPHAAVIRGGKIEWIGHPSELEPQRLAGWLGK